MADTHHITIDQGADYTEVWEYYNPDGTPIDLTGYTAKLMVRETPDAAGPPLVSLDTEGNGITIDGPAGEITVDFTHAITAGLAPGRYRYDLKIYSPDATPRITELGEGWLTYDATCTRADT